MNNKPIEIQNLGVFFGKFCVLKDISFSIDAGDFVTIIGPNGGGKTTLIKVILGLINPTEGNISVFGKKPTEVPFEYIGYVPQIKTLDRTFPAKPIELVATGLFGNWKYRLTDATKEKCRKAMEIVGIGELAERPLNKLSGGELQRVYLARSLVRNPKLLILDEPATGVDTIAEIDFSILLDNYLKQSNATILMVTHDWEYAFHHSSKVLLLNKKAVAFGSPQTIFTEEHLHRTFGHTGHTHTMEFIIKKDG